MEIRKIDSRQNPAVIRWSQLQNKKYRDESGLFLLEGIKLFREAVMAGVTLESVLVREDCGDLLSEAQRLLPDAPFALLSAGAFDKITTEKSPEGIIGVAKYLDISHKYIKIDRKRADGYGGERIMLFSQIRDPGNLGTIIRSALAFGFDRLILSADCADLYHGKTVRAAMGSLFKMKIDIAEDFEEAIRSLKAAGRRVLAAMPAEGSLSLREGVLSPLDCVVIGNEGHGIPGETAALCTAAVVIPMAPGAESLNAAIAASVFLWAQRGV